MNPGCSSSLPRSSSALLLSNSPLLTHCYLKEIYPASELVFIPRQWDHTAAAGYPRSISQKHSCVCGPGASSYKMLRLSFPRSKLESSAWPGSPGGFLSLHKRKWQSPISSEVINRLDANEQYFQHTIPFFRDMETACIQFYFRMLLKSSYLTRTVRA